MILKYALAGASGLAVVTSVWAALATVQVSRLRVEVAELERQVADLEAGIAAEEGLRFGVSTIDGLNDSALDLWLRERGLAPGAALRPRVRPAD